MPNWLYQYFQDIIKPMLVTKDGRKLEKPVAYKDYGPHSPLSFWIHPPEPIFDLSQHRFNPISLYRPCVYLWLPHHLVDNMRCPKCGHDKLEKQGALPPRRIFDLEDVFYLVAWAYYCRHGCRSYFKGWSQALLESLPQYIRLSFPAILSYKSGLSHWVMTHLRVGNQHKMGPRGVRSLLYEMHTVRFNILQLQYIECIVQNVIMKRVCAKIYWVRICVWYQVQCMSMER